jgi:rubrerythrin
MPEFTQIPCIETSEDVAGAVRLSIAAELEAVNLYRGIAARCNNPKVRALMLEVAEDELRHVGTFRRLMQALQPGDVERETEGMAEADEVIGK